ncbi:MAG: DUF3891 family protein [Planctomycetales bacterium]|nr:DUF3891 family protein [Planctomycetales bacterium]
MLRTVRNGDVWFVSQPDHAAVSGYLAAHWGNKRFSPLGCFSPVVDAARSLRAECVFGIAQHDNGWWEWEADPELCPSDHLPLDLFDDRMSRQGGFRRWLAGIERNQDRHPYASLLISWHAYWLYEPSLRPDSDRAFLHPLFWKDNTPTIAREEVPATERFLEQLASVQLELAGRVQSDSRHTSWVEPALLHPHVRLLQILDGISLAICSALVPSCDGPTCGHGEDRYPLFDVPSSSWEDRVRIDVHPLGERRIRFEPYPFDRDPLPVTVPARVVSNRQNADGPFHVRWQAIPQTLLRYEFSSV